jgi:hypothetical protein
LQYGGGENRFGQTSQYGGGGNSTMINWERKGYPSKQIHDQIKAIADEGSSPELKLTLLMALKDSLEGYQMEEPEKKTPVEKKPHWQKGGRSFLMYMALKDEPETKPFTFLSAPPKQKYPFKIAYKLPFISFPIGNGKTQ